MCGASGFEFHNIIGYEQARLQMEGAGGVQSQRNQDPEREGVEDVMVSEDEMPGAKLCRRTQSAGMDANYN